MINTVKLQYFNISDVTYDRKALILALYVTQGYNHKSLYSKSSCLDYRITTNSFKNN